jgi:hypothetical protein
MACGIALAIWACPALAETNLAKARKNKTVVTYSSGFAISQRVSEMAMDPLVMEEGAEIHEPGPGPMRWKAAAGPLLHEDPVLQKQATPLVSASVGANFAGIVSPGYVPSDSNLAVGPNHIVEVVNVAFAVYSKNGALLAGPTNLQSLFSSLGGNCVGSFGDPIVLYDRAADRWVLSIIGSNQIGSASAECVAVSTTNDPTGSYYLYGYLFGSNLNDYPKLSTWATATNSAYLATYNIYQQFRTLIGSDICGLDRTKMLVGDPTAAQLCQMTPTTEFGYLPSDMDGPTPPADGTPGLFINWQNNNPGQLYLRQLALNFATGMATLSPPTVINVANSVMVCTNGGQCIPQAGATQTLDSLGDRLMYRFAIRHFADHDRAVVNHTVANGSQAAVRWYELYDPAGAVTVNQQGTYAPDATYRWMGSLAEDASGDIGLGYSASSSTIHPSICFTGRMPTDALGTMESENTMVQGIGSQIGTDAYRWGDYTAMQVDPSDDCTFWYVDQYQAVTGTFDWSTNIASFKFNNCAAGPSFSITASPNTATIAPGSPGTSTITVVPAGGFSNSVALSASGLPTGVTAKFKPATTATTSTLTLTAGASATSGTSTITINGVSGGVTETTTLSLTVNGPSFTLSANPNTVSVAQGSQGTSTITVTPVNGFSGNATLSASGLPSGVTAGFSPNPTGTTSTLTLTASGTAALGTSTVTITGVSGGITQTTTLSLTVTVGPNFSLTASPNSVTILQGNQGTSTITVVPANGFTGSVTLSASGLPSGVTAGFGTNPTTATSLLTLTASGTAAVGTTTVTITGVSGSITQTTTLSLTISGPTFSLSASPNTLSFGQGGQGTSTITVVPVNGFNGSVTLSASGLPNGVTAGFGTNPTTATSLLTLTASGTATPGNSTVTITGVSGNISQTTTVSLTITGGPTFSLTARPTSVTVAQGGQGSSTISVVPANGFNGSVTLSASGMPSGVTAVFSPNPTTSTSTLTLTATSNAAVGASTVTVTGISGSITQTTTVNLTVTGGGGTSVSVSPTSLTFPQTAVGKTSAAQVVTLQNNGSSALSITRIMTTGDFASGGGLKGDCGSTLAANSSCAVQVTFTPTVKGVRTGYLIFYDSAPNSPQMVTLTGTGTGK